MSSQQPLPQKAGHLSPVLNSRYVLNVNNRWKKNVYKRYTTGQITKWTTMDITKTCLYNCDPLKPHFYIVKLRFTGVYVIFLISTQNIDYGYSLWPPRRDGSIEYPQSMFWAETWTYQIFFSGNFHFLVVKFSIYLNRRVFLMKYNFI